MLHENQFMLTRDFWHCGPVNKINVTQNWHELFCGFLPQKLVHFKKIERNCRIRSFDEGQPVSKSIQKYPSIIQIAIVRKKKK